LSLARTAALLLTAGAGVALAACQSTQDKAEEVQARAAELIASQKPLTIPKPTKDVKVIGTTVLSDENGSAVVVELQNMTRRTLVGVPILLDVRDAQEKSIFRNDAFGSEYALNHVPVMKPGESLYWVNDQILTGSEPEAVRVKVGPPEGTAPEKMPEISVSDPEIHEDPSGVEIEGTATNQSGVDQKDLVLFAVATRGGEVVAAGRGRYKNLRGDAPRPLRYNIFFIGDPRGAEIQITAPPSVLE
jgi:hypothetical protein